MSGGNEPVEVRLLDKPYLVACPAEEREGLREAARLLDERLRGMRQANKTATLEKIAVLAALNLAHERLQAEARGQRNEREIARLLDDVDHRLASLSEGASRG